MHCISSFFSFNPIAIIRDLAMLSGARMSRTTERAASRAVTDFALTVFCDHVS